MGRAGLTVDLHLLPPGTLKLQKQGEADHRESLAAGTMRAGVGLGSGASSLGFLFSLLVPEAGLAGIPMWKERSEELGSDPVTPRVLIPRGPRCHKVKGHVMFDPAFALAPEGNEAKAEGH